MKKEFWNSRYKDETFAYGEEPNVLLKNILDSIPTGKILLPAEGEGRNAVYAASKGFDVFAFDISEEGKRKAERLSNQNQVKIHYLISDFESFAAEENSFDCIALVFTHLPSDIREMNFRKLINYLKPDGLMIVIGFSKNQLEKPSGGSKDIDMLFSKEQLIDDFKVLRNIKVHEFEMNLKEGPFHDGIASLIQFTGIK